MVVKLKIRIDPECHEEQVDTLYIYRDRIEADTYTPSCGFGCCQPERHHRTLAYDDWFLMNNTMRKIMKKD